MNTFVVYDSQYGNTARIAQTIAQTLKAFGPTRREPVGKVSVNEWQDVDLLVLGCPTQSRGPTPAMLAFLVRAAPNALDGLDIACFDTRFPLPRFLTGSAAHWMVQNLRKLGALVLMPPESFFVKGRQGPLKEGELRRADGWARALHNRIEDHRPATI